MPFMYLQISHMAEKSSDINTPRISLNCIIYIYNISDVRKKKKTFLIQTQAGYCRLTVFVMKKRVTSVGTDAEDFFFCCNLISLRLQFRKCVLRWVLVISFFFLMCSLMLHRKTHKSTSKNHIELLSNIGHILQNRETCNKRAKTCSKFYLE